MYSLSQTFYFWLELEVALASVQQQQQQHYKQQQIFTRRGLYYSCGYFESLNVNVKRLLSVSFLKSLFTYLEFLAITLYIISCTNTYSSTIVTKV